MGLGKLTKKMHKGITFFCLSLLLLSYDGIAQKFYSRAGGEYKVQGGKTNFIDTDPNDRTFMSPAPVIDPGFSGVNPTTEPSTDQPATLPLHYANASSVGVTMNF